MVSFQLISCLPCLFVFVGKRKGSLAKLTMCPRKPTASCQYFAQCVKTFSTRFIVNLISVALMKGHHMFHVVKSIN